MFSDRSLMQQMAMQLHFIQMMQKAEEQAIL
jgi:hypothetical protein